MPEIDLARTALIIKGHNDPAKAVVCLPRNKDHLVHAPMHVRFGSQPADVDPESRDCTPAPHVTEPELHLRFEYNLKDPAQGWRFGIDNKNQEICDVLLGMRDEIRRSGKKISAKHFRIFFNLESGMLVLQNESQHGTILRDADLERKDRTVSLMGTETESLDPEKVTMVTVADLKFLLYVPTLDGQQKLRHEAEWQAFAQKCKDATPGLGQLTLCSSASTRPPSRRNGGGGGYTLLEEIGRGEYGIVRRAVEYRSGAVYAVKAFFKMKETQEARNLSEIATLRKLSHTNIVKYVDLIVDQAGLALVMEFMPSSLKAQHLQERISRADLKTITKQVLEGVAYLHCHKHVHRDIKPENILLKRDPLTAKLSDFGLAARDGFLTTECGTKKYAAPEISFGHYDRSVDTWSTGVSAFDIIEDLPDEPDWLNHQDWGAEIQSRIITACRKRNDSFLELLKGMLQVNPKARPSAEACSSDPRLEHSFQDDEIDLGFWNRSAGWNLPGTISPTDTIPDYSLPTPLQDDVPTAPEIPLPTSVSETVGQKRSSESLLQPAEESVRISRSRHSQGVQTFIECPVQNKVIHVRASDNMICLDDIARVGGRTDNWVETQLKRIPVESKDTSRYGTLIDYGSAIPYIREFCLVNALWRSGIRESYMYRGNTFRPITFEMHTVYVCSSLRLINATHLLKAAEIPRIRLRETISNCHIKNIVAIKGHSKIQGSYVSYDDAPGLCRHLGLNPPGFINKAQIMPEDASGTQYDAAGCGRGDTESSTSMNRSVFTKPSQSHGSYLPIIKELSFSNEIL